MTVQIAVKLPARLVSDLDGMVRSGRFASRSAAVRAGIEALARDERSRAIDDAFRAGVTARPDTDADVEEAWRLGADAIDEEPWEPWW